MDEKTGRASVKVAGGDGQTRQKYRLLFWIGALVVITDQLTKAAVLNYIPLHGDIPVIAGFFSLTHLYNPGGAFGLMAGSSEALRTFFFIFVSSAAVIVILVFFHQTPRSHRVLASGLALILGGAVGNLIDRFRFGKVLDFIDLYIRELHWPAFNVADSAISIGMVILAWHLVFGKMPGSGR